MAQYANFVLAEIAASATNVQVALDVRLKSPGRLPVASIPDKQRLLLVDDLRRPTKFEIISFMRTQVRPANVVRLLNVERGLEDTTAQEWDEGDCATSDLLASQFPPLGEEDAGDDDVLMFVQGGGLALRQISADQLTDATPGNPIVLEEVALPPAAPDSGEALIYAEDGFLKSKFDSGYVDFLTKPPAANYVAGTVDGSSSASSLTVNRPFGTTDGDLLILFTAVRQAGHIMSPPAGFTLLSDDDVFFGIDGNLRVQVSWRIADSEPPSTNVPMGTTAGCRAHMIRLTGGPWASNPIGAVESVRSGSTTSINFSGIDLTTNGLKFAYLCTYTTPGSTTDPLSFSAFAFNSSLQPSTRGRYEDSVGASSGAESFSWTGNRTAIGVFFEIRCAS